MEVSNIIGTLPYPYDKRRETTRGGRYGDEAPRLPEDVITQIVLCLPVKPLLRFSSVCKSWCTLLSDRSFLYSHLNRSLQNKDIFSVFFQESKDSFHLPTPINFHSPIQPLKQLFLFTLDNRRVRIFGSCNGLICLCDLYFETIHLLNPSTRSYSPLPNPHYGNTNPPYKPCHDRVFGFSYSTFTGEYKVIQILYYNSNLVVDFEMSEVHVHTIGTSSWRIRRIHILGFIDSPSPGTSLNGSLHWLTTYRSYGSTLPVIVVAFDVESEKIHHLPLPPNFSDDCNCKIGSDIKCYLSVFQGCLCVFRNNFHDKSVEVWEMKEYGVTDSWTKKFSIEHPSIVSNFRYYKPLRFFQNGEILLKTPRNLIVYCPRSESARVMIPRSKSSGRAIISYDAIDYVESLVHVKD